MKKKKNKTNNFFERKCDFCSSISKIKTSVIKIEIEKDSYDSACGPHFSWQEAAIAYGQPRAKMEYTTKKLIYICPICKEKNVIKEETIDTKQIGTISPSVDDVAFFHKAIRSREQDD